MLEIDHNYLTIYIYIYMYIIIIYICIYIYIYIGVRGFPSRVILSLSALGPGSGPFPGLFVASRVAGGMWLRSIRIFSVARALLARALLAPTTRVWKDIRGKREGRRKRDY